MVRIPNISRYRAASYHLALSAGIAALVLSLMLAVWYPPPLFDAMGGIELLILIVGVDVCIGPLMTLIVFDTRKRELARDLAVILVVQLAALAYGSYAMYAGRPVFVVFAENHLIVVSAAELETAAVAKAARPEFRSLSLTGPVWVAADMPTDNKARQDIAFAALSGLGIQNLPQYYVPYAERRQQALARARPLQAPAGLSANDVSAIDEVLSDSRHSREETRFLPAIARRGLLTVLIDAKTGDVLGIVPVDPRVLAELARPVGARPAVPLATIPFGARIAPT